MEANNALLPGIRCGGVTLYLCSILRFPDIIVFLKIDL